MYVIGTAGHVDHGKSTLVKALTGIDPDRLKEEKEREMTIDLGFAWVQLVEGQDEVGIVDVPGHRDFIENMLAGVGGIDLALLVVAADEGVMPQTREHLAILDLLGVHSGVVALTKIDVVEDPEWLELVSLDVSEAVLGTVLEEAPLIPVSALTGQGLEQLKSALAEGLSRTDVRPDLGRPRLPIDRVFSITGFGTIVTGTLQGGSLAIGDAVEIQPAKLTGRIRGLQTHRHKLEAARPGSRVAVNLSGVAKESIKRGYVVARPGDLSGTILCDVAYRHLVDAGEPLKHNVNVKLFVGAAEVMARTRVLGARHVEPGSEGWLQLALNEPLALARGDRFILRRPSPAATIGGGRILDPYPGRRHRRFRPEVVERLEQLAKGDPLDLLLQTIIRLEPVSKSDLQKQAGLEPADLEVAWSQLQESGGLVLLGDLAMAASSRDRILDRMASILGDYHQRFPLRQGVPREEFRSRLRQPATIFNALLMSAASQGFLVDRGATICLPGHEVRLTEAQQKRVDSVIASFTAAGINSPSVREVRASLGEELYQALLEDGRIVQLSPEVVYEAELYKNIVARIGSYLEKNQRVNAAQLRDLLNTSRKYAIAFLEHLDDIKMTRRVGDDRVLVEQR